MKRISVLCLVVFFISTALLAAQEYHGPKIEVRELRYDFGKVAQGTQVSHVFEVKNAGEEVLVIEKVQSS